MLRTCQMLGACAAASLAASAGATVTGLQAEYGGIVGGRHVWSVYVVSSNVNNVLLQVVGHTVVAGSMANVQHNDLGDGTWRPEFTVLQEQISNDSFVTITGLHGNGTSLDPGFGSGSGSSIPDGSGWFTSSPGNPILFTGGRIKIMQIAGNYGVAGGGILTGRLTVGYRLNVNSTSTVYAQNLTYNLFPSPGGLAVLMIAAGLRRHRRARGSRVR